MSSARENATPLVEYKIFPTQQADGTDILELRSEDRTFLCVMTQETYRKLAHVFDQRANEMRALA